MKQLLQAPTPTQSLLLSAARSAAAAVKDDFRRQKLSA